MTTALRMLASEFQHAVQAERVLTAIGHGETAHGRISDRSGVKGNTLSEALEVLVERKGLVGRNVPYAVPPGRQPARYVVLDTYLRFWLASSAAHLAELSRGRGDLVIARIERDWPAYRGRAVEPVVREALERLLGDPARAERLGGARHVGSWWKRDHSIEVDLVGGDAPDPNRIGFVGSIKWHERRPFDPSEIHTLTAARAAVPGAAGAKLVAVSRSGVADPTGLDEVLGPDDLLAAWA